MKYQTKFAVTLAASLAFSSAGLWAKEVIELEPSAEDMTPVVRAALEGVKDSEVKLVFKKGTYKFRPDYAMAGYRVITNHGNGIKNIAFSFEDFDSVEIEGNGSEFIFHGQIAPFQFYRNDKVTVKDLTIDWDIPFTFTAEVLAVNEKEGWRDVKPFTGTHQWKLSKGHIQFPNVDGFNYPYLGSTLAFDPVTKAVYHGSWDLGSKPTKVERRPNGVLRIYEKMRQYPPVGSWLNSKGDRHNDRYAPAFQVRNSKNITFDGVVIHHALGMAFLFERAEDIKILNSGVYLRDEKNGKRVISSTADATHFANCKGDILIDNSRFENMLDDGVNVHGTYVEVNKVLDDHTLVFELKHFEQLGFEFAGKGDEIWFIKQPSVQKGEVNTVKSVKMINERFTELTFEDKLPKLKKGDILENKTWNPTFTVRNSVFRDHRARNLMLKTPLKTVIENNYFSAMMSCIMFRGESFFWYESSAVEDVLIRNNTFENCAYSASEHAVLNISPRLGKSFNQNEIYDRNIRFVNNTVKTFDDRIVWADRVDGLEIKNNTIEKVKDAKRPQIHPDRPVFEFKKSSNIELKNNSYKGDFKQAVKADAKSAKTLKDDGSIK